MRYYTLTIDCVEKPEQLEYSTEEERDEAAESIFDKMSRIFNVVVVLSLDVDEDGSLTVEALQRYKE